ncbi:MAG TPA: cytochrome c biogenesis protein CcsA [Verrucomicrobiae bacterium]|nr:cytochrome c biogenesis protein CcsA [Verrucomicrobiae bacterium]
MDWFTARHTFLLAVLAYGASMIYSVFLWRKGFRRDDRVNYLLLLAAFVLHTLAMFQRGFSINRCPVNNLFEATMFFSWAATLAFLIVGAVRRFRFLGAFASPVLFAVGVFALMPPLDPPHGPKPEFSGGLASLHAAMILLAYGAFGIGAAAAGMFLTQQHNLKFNKLRAVLSVLPPIQRLDIVATRVVLIGFVLLTIGLAAGGQLPRPEGVTYWKDAKVLWSAVLWVLYAGLLFSRMKFDFAGRRFALGTIGVFSFVLLTFWVTNLLSPLHHP